jgi:hypothetical protein
VGLSSAGSRITITVLERARDQRVAA